MKRAIAFTLSILMLLGTVFAVVLSLTGCKPMDKVVVIPTPTPEPTPEPTVDPLATPEAPTPTPEPVYSSTSANGTPVQSHTLHSFSEEELQTYLQSVNNTAMMDFSLPDIAGSGSSVKLADYRGKVVVVTAMASWCHWCKAQLPYLKSIAEKYSQDRVAFVGIDTFENATGDAEQLLASLREDGIGFSVGLDESSEIGQFMSPRGSIPVTMVLDTQGVIRFYLPGAIQDEIPLTRMIDFTLTHQGKMPPAA